MCTKKNLFVSSLSNGPTSGSLQPRDHNLQFHTWLSATAEVVWIARVRHIPSSVSLFIVLIFCERFISFRKSSRKRWMPISCCPAREGGVWTAGAGGMEMEQIEPTKKKSCLHTNCLHFLLIEITACFVDHAYSFIHAEISVPPNTWLTPSLLYIPSQRKIKTSAHLFMKRAQIGAANMIFPGSAYSFVIFCRSMNRIRLIYHLCILGDATRGYVV